MSGPSGVQIMTPQSDAFLRSAFALVTNDYPDEGFEECTSFVFTAVSAKGKRLEYKALYHPLQQNPFPIYRRDLTSKHQLLPPPGPEEPSRFMSQLEAEIDAFLRIQGGMIEERSLLDALEPQSRQKPLVDIILALSQLAARGIVHRLYMPPLSAGPYADPIAYWIICQT